MKSALMFAVFVWLLPFSLTQNVQGSNSSDVSALLTDTKNSEFLRFIFQGSPGRDGRDGRDGHDGHDGNDGHDGHPGLPGIAGAAGVNTVTAGLPGPMGPQGLPGRNASSIPGPQGPRGFLGRPGKQGPAGIDGNAGLRGQNGSPGPVGPPGRTGLPGSNAGTSGAVYVRWGRTTCPSISELAYAGIAGGKWYQHQGSGSNYLCLPEDPEYDDYQTGAQSNRAYVYSAEYETSDFPPYADKYQHDVTCAVCRTSNRGSAMMIPAKMTCPSGWTREYHGYLMAEFHSSHHSTEFVCVDRNPEVVSGSSANQNGALFYPVEGRCDAGNLPCAPYINGAELTCVVCSK